MDPPHPPPAHPSLLALRHPALVPSHLQATDALAVQLLAADFCAALSESVLASNTPLNTDMGPLARGHALRRALSAHYGAEAMRRGAVAPLGPCYRTREQRRLGLHSGRNTHLWRAAVVRRRWCPRCGARRRDGVTSVTVRGPPVAVTAAASVRGGRKQRRGRRGQCVHTACLVCLERAMGRRSFRRLVPQLLLSRREARSSGGGGGGGPAPPLEGGVDDDGEEALRVVERSGSAAACAALDALGDAVLGQASLRRRRRKRRRGPAPQGKDREAGTVGRRTAEPKAPPAAVVVVPRTARSRRPAAAPAVAVVPPSSSSSAPATATASRSQPTTGPAVPVRTAKSVPPPRVASSASAARKTPPPPVAKAPAARAAPASGAAAARKAPPKKGKKPSGGSGVLDAMKSLGF